MTYDTLVSEAMALVEEIERNPEDRDRLHVKLRDRIATLRARDMPVPENLHAYEQALTEEDVEARFDNLPV